MVGVCHTFWNVGSAEKPCMETYPPAKARGSIFRIPKEKNRRIEALAKAKSTFVQAKCGLSEALRRGWLS